MKITVKDGKVVSVEPLDTTGNNFSILQDGVDQNARVHTSMREDCNVDPSNLLISGIIVDTILNRSKRTFSIETVEESEKPEKGSSLSERIELASEVLDIDSAIVQYMSGKDNDSKKDVNPTDFHPEAGWEVITYETYEGSFPAIGWNCYAGSGFADAYWDVNSYRSNNSTWSMFCADMGTAAVTPPAAYPVDMNTWAVYGPFDLSDATGAELDFMLWLDSESSYDYFKYMISTDGVNYYGYQTSGNSGGWSSRNIDLSSVPTIGDVTGASSVYFAMVFESDYSVNYEGAFVDDVLLQKYIENPEDPDLQWSNLALSTDTWSVGDNVTADLEVENSGTTAAGAHYSRIYLSSDDLISTGDIQLGGDLYFISIDAASTSTFTGHQFTVPSQPDGTYYLGAIVDIYNDIPETDETNNGGHRGGLVTIGSLPDLEWSTLLFQSNSWVIGSSVNTSLTVDNIGSQTAGAHYSRIFVSTDDVISDGDTPMGNEINFGSIPAGESGTESTSFTVPNMPGTYWVGAVIDLYNDVAESNESNNAGARSTQVTITENPESDLAPLNMTLSESQWNIGSTIYSDITEENIGGLNAGAHESMIVMSVDNSLSTSDVQLGSLVSFPDINAGASSMVSTSWQVPDISQGTYYLGLLVDVNDDVSESDESNNIGVRNGTVEIIGIPAPEIHVAPTSLTIIEPVDEQALQAEQGDLGPIQKTSGLSVDGPYIPNQVIVRFKGSEMTSLKGLSASSRDFELFSSKHKVMELKEMRKPVKQLETNTNSSTLLIQLEHEGTMQEVIGELIEMDIVEHAEPNHLLKHDDDLTQEYEPSDPLFQFQWGLKNTGNAVAVGGSLVGSPGSDINAINAWDITAGSSSIIVAVIDDGIDPLHPEFIGKIINGYDFVDDDTDPTGHDGDFHGNACAGIIAAADDGQGTVGVAPGVRLMPLRVCNSVGCSSSNIIDAIYYAVDNGARVISISLGGGSFSSFMDEAINYAVLHNVVVFASAGNDNEDNLVNSHYPSGYTNCISVGAMSPCGERKTPSTCDGETWWGSNYGDLDFITPGTRVYSTDISGPEGYSQDNYVTNFNGTSAACPHAAGVAALILSIDPSYSSLQVRQFMQQGSVDIGATGYDAQSGYGRLDAHLGLQLVQVGGFDQVIISNQGNADLNISDISDDMTWMTLSHNAVPLILHAGGSIIVEINVDWNLISATETGHITINSDDADEGAVVVDVTASPLSISTYMITAVANPTSGGFVEGAGEKVINQDVILIASPASTYDFVSWTENGIVVSTNQVYSFVATSDRHLVANFELKSFDIAASANPSSGGAISGAGTFEYGDMATLTATAAAGYTFTNWTDGVRVLSTNAVYSFSVTENLALTANFSMEYYSIIASIEPVGTGIVTGTGAYTYSQTVQLQAVAATGYEFDDWIVEGVTVSTMANYSFAAVADIHLVARFSVQSLDVTTIANPAGAGTITGGGTYSYGSTVTLLATSAVGFEFINWTIDDIEVSSNPSYKFNVYQNSDVVANFKTVSTLVIQTSSIPPEGGMAVGGGQFVYGNLVILAAVPAEGYQLSYWIDENDVVITDNNPYSFTVVEDAHIKAVFVPKNTTGAEPIEEEHLFKLYPNPVGDNLYVKFNIDLNQSTVISLYDLNGKVISNYKEFPYYKGVVKLNTSHLIPGMYFIRITEYDTGAQFTGKVIKR